MGRPSAKVNYFYLCGRVRWTVSSASVVKAISCNSRILLRALMSHLETSLRSHQPNLAFWARRDRYFVLFTHLSAELKAQNHAAFYARMSASTYFILWHCLGCRTSHKWSIFQIIRNRTLFVTPLLTMLLKSLPHRSTADLKDKDRLKICPWWLASVSVASRVSHCFDLQGECAPSFYQQAPSPHSNAGDLPRTQFGLEALRLAKVMIYELIARAAKAWVIYSYEVTCKVPSSLSWYFGREDALGNQMNKLGRDRTIRWTLGT